MDDQKKTILVVEDDVGISRSVADELTGSGFNVMTAMDGEEGLKTALSKHPDLILLDIMMPKMNGLEVLKALRGDSWGKHVLVIIVTALDSSNDILKALIEFEPSYYMIKASASLSDITLKVKQCLKMT